MSQPGTAAITGLVLDGAGLTLGSKRVLSGLTLRLTEARIGIVGRNGSGKTSLLRLLGGLVAPTEGSVTIDGIDPSGDRAGLVRRLGILFQNPDHQIIFPTVEEELAFGLRQIGLSDAEARQGARRVLDAHGRGHWRNASVQTLSQGQRQFLCLMAVLAMAPATILLDEPYAALDLPTAARLRRELASLSARVVIVSHDPAVVVGMDRVLWLEDGRVRADGSPAVVLPQFATEMARLGEQDADADLAG